MLHQQITAISLYYTCSSCHPSVWYTLYTICSVCIIILYTTQHSYTYKTRFVLYIYFCMFNKHTHRAHMQMPAHAYPYTIIHHTYSSLIYTHSFGTYLHTSSTYTFGHMHTYAYQYTYSCIYNTSNLISSTRTDIEIY